MARLNEGLVSLIISLSGSSSLVLVEFFGVRSDANRAKPIAGKELESNKSLSLCRSGCHRRISDFARLHGGKVESGDE